MSVTAPLGFVASGVHAHIRKEKRDLATDRARSLEWQLYVSRINRAHGEWLANNVAEAEQLLDACKQFSGVDLSTA